MRVFRFICILWVVVSSLYIQGIRAHEAMAIVSRETRNAPKIIPLYSAFSDILLALGVEDAIVARTTRETRSEFIALPTVGTYIHPNIEKILGLQADIVLFVKGRGEVAQQMQFLQERGVRVEALPMETLENVYSAIEYIGFLYGKEVEAKHIIASLRARVARVRKCVEQEEPTLVFVELRYPHLLTAGASSIVAEVVRIAGGRYPISIDKKTVPISEEQLLAINPSVYIQQQGPMNPVPYPVEKNTIFQHISAISTGRILRVNDGKLSLASIYSIDMIEWLAEQLHPETYALCRVNP